MTFIHYFSGTFTLPSRILAFASSTAFYLLLKGLLLLAQPLCLSMSKQSLVHQGIHLFLFCWQYLYSCTNLFQCRYKNKVRFFTIFRSVFTFCCLVTVYTDNPNFFVFILFSFNDFASAKTPAPVPPAAW